jgi:hypothetical protein
MSKRCLRSIGRSVRDAIASRSFWVLATFVFLLADLPRAARDGAVFVLLGMLVLLALLVVAVWWMGRHDEHMG